jgi:8-amino-7-oxononanoate synthase
MKPASKIEQKLSERLETRKSNSRFRQLTTTSPKSVDFSSNDFLSLSTSPDLRKAFLHELKNGPQGDDFQIGSGGSRLLDGNSKYADDLEKSIAEFHGAPSGLLWNSGFDANSGLFACVPQTGDVIIHDELIHASVHDGMKLSRASKKLSFEHNSIENLEKVIRTCIGEFPKIGQGGSSVFIALESIYSMDGDIAPLAAIVELVERVLPQGNGHIIIDEAHSTGVLGSSGRGLVCELGLESKMFARLHTFGKSLACSGGKFAHTRTSFGR